MEDHPTASGPTTIRLALAEQVAHEARTRWGAACRAVAVYGSVAHGAARRYSDLEVVVLTTEEVVAQETQVIRDGILVEVDVLPARAMLSAAGRVTPFWGLEADQYRVFAPLYDPSALFPQVRAASLAVPPVAFVQPLHHNELGLLEVLGKFCNAADEQDAATMRDVGWQYAHAAALRAALLDRRPFESGRTLWANARGRGFGLNALISALAEGPAASLPEAVLAVTRAFGIAWPLSP